MLPGKRKKQGEKEIVPPPGRHQADDARVSRAQLARPRSPLASAASAASQSRAGSLCSALAESSVSRAKTSDAAAAS